MNHEDHLTWKIHLWGRQPHRVLLLTVVGFLRHEKAFECVHTGPSTAQEDSTDTLLLVPFKKMNSSYYHLWKMEIWVMAWDFSGILFLFLLIILHRIARKLLAMGRGGERSHNSHFELRGRMCLCHFVTSHLNKRVSLFFPRVSYGRLNSDVIWARRKSRRLPMIPGGIYISKSGKVYFIIEKNVCMEVNNQCTDFMVVRKRDNVPTKEYKPTGCYRG